MPSGSRLPSPLTVVASRPALPKRASAAAVVNSLVLEARMRARSARERNTPRFSVALTT